MAERPLFSSGVPKAFGAQPRDEVENVEHAVSQSLNYENHLTHSIRLATKGDDYLDKLSAAVNEERHVLLACAVNEELHVLLACSRLSNKHQLSCEVPLF